MRKITLLAIMFAFFMAMIAGCGGGGGSEEPTACVDSVWSPDPSTVPEGQVYEQTSNCGTKRNTVGTKKMWLAREGESVASMFVSFLGVTQNMVAEADGSGGLFAFGRSSELPDNKGLLYKINPDSSYVMLARIDSPLGNTIFPKGITVEGKILLSYERFPLQDWSIYAYDLSGNGGIISETNMGYGLQKLNHQFDGDSVVMSRIPPATPLPAPFPYSETLLVRASLVSSDTPMSTAPLLNPEFMTVDSAGINIAGRGSWMKYDRAFNVTIDITSLGEQSERIIHDMKSYQGKTYVAWAGDGILKISQLGNSAFRNTEGAPVGSDKVKLAFTAEGKLLCYLGNRIGYVDLDTGEFSTRNPPAVPANADLIVSGSNAYFITGENKTEVHKLELSVIHSN